MNCDSQHSNSLQSWDLLLGTLFFARLILWLLWDKLTIIECIRSCCNYIGSLTEYLANSCGDSWIESVVILIDWCLGPVFLHFFGTTDVWNLKRIMSDSVQHKIKCGGAGDGTLQRVHIDNACVMLTNAANITDHAVLSRNDQCYQCALTKVWQSHDTQGVNLSMADSSFQVQTRYPTQLQIQLLSSQESVCNTTYHFEQFGVYSLDVDSCHISVEKKPVNAFLPIFWAFVILCMLAGLRLAYQSVYKTAIFRRFLVWLHLRSENRLIETTDEQDTATLVENAEIIARQSRRVRSLDAFRGLSITIMIFVNYGGGSYYFFNHSPWNGLTVADLVFPWFIWIMGVSLAISTQSQLRNSVSRKKIVLRVIKRSVILIMLGLIINSEGGHNDLRTMRFPGVLQRFGLTYLIVGLAESALLPRQFPDVAHPVLDLTSSGWQWLLAGLCLTIHCFITFQLPVPGCPMAYLGPGGLADNATHRNCTGGAAMWVDVSIFGRDHIYQHPSSTAIYQGSAHDPEGLLGTLNSVVLCWLGVAAGKILLVHKDWRERIKRWIMWGIITGLIAGGLSGFTQNTGVIPINKNLWSVSFIMATGSMAFMLLSSMYLLIDVYRFWSGSPFIFPGMNSILMYMGHEIMSGMFPFSWKPFTESHAEILAMNLWGCGLWVVASYILYEKKLFLAL